jgi:hypothetical protein
MNNKKQQLFLEITENEDSELSKALESYTNKEQNSSLTVSNSCQTKSKKSLL